jgi:fumarate reductase flavoprotein subunit
VNQQGKRFCDEGITANWPFAGNAIARQKHHHTYLIFDEATKRHIEEQGLDIGAGSVFPTTKTENIKALFKDAIDKNNDNVFMAESLHDLSNAMGINPDIFRETVDEYNSFSTKNHDDHFNKKPQYLRPVKTAPFYAMRIFLRFLGTLGGIKINEKTEVINRDLEVIQGLYAAGNDAGGIFVDSYDLWIPGGALGFALNSGRIAGRYAARYSLS